MPVQVQVKSMLNKTKRRDPWFLDDYTINPYSGCSFNCLYCYIRGSKYGIHMEQKLGIKQNALEVLEKQLTLRARKEQYGVIVLASATEPYLQVEKDTQLTRQILDLIRRFRFPVHIITKSRLVTRDFDILKEINETAILPPDLAGRLPGKTMITFSFSTLDPVLAHIFEPGATPPDDRLATLREAIAAGFHAGVSLMPILPLLTDSQESLDHFFATFREAGAKYVFPASITLFGDDTSSSKTLVFQAIQKHFPDKYEAFSNLFAGGFQIDWNYRNELNKKIKAARQRHYIPDAIISLS